MAIALTTLLAPTAHAQHPAPDAVRLRGGGWLRGTIAEYVPGEHVTIVLPSGEVRRVEGSEIEAAGPAGAVLPTAPIPVQVIPTPPPASPVRFASNHPRLTVALRVGTATGVGIAASRYGAHAFLVQAPVHDRVCDVPCERLFSPGVHSLAVSIGGSVVVPDDPLMHVAGPTRVEIGWWGREAERIAGILLCAVGGALFGIGGLVSFAEFARGAGREHALRDLGIAGMVAFGLSFAVGLPLAFWNDTFRLSQDPPIPPDARPL